MINKQDGSAMVLSSATGCLYKQNNQIYLITNWHVLSGLNAETKLPMDTTNSALPDCIRVYFRKNDDVTKEIVQCYPLKNGNDADLWLEHSLSNAIDVAALEIIPPHGVTTYLISDAIKAPAQSSRQNFFFVTQDVWVIGFPLGIKTNGLPLWKKATIACEPHYSSLVDQHKILIDTATRRGMSGSPVFIVDNNLTPIRFDDQTQEVDFPSLRVLLGIYSGRIDGRDEMAAQIGIVWRAECIAEILSIQKLYVPTYASNPDTASTSNS